MIFIKDPYITIVLTLLCFAGIYLANVHNVFGKIVNKFFPCNQDPTSSFPCYGIYDVAAMCIFACIILYLAISLATTYLAK